MPFQADHAHDLLCRARQQGRMAHAYLISGTRGSELEDFACRFISLLIPAAHRTLEDWLQEDVVVLRPQSKSRKISVGEHGDEPATMRYLEKMIHRTVGKSGQKVAVIVDAERMTHQAQNAFLKTLEEPPPQTLLLLLTAHPQQLLPTVLSRVIQIPLLPGSGAKKLSPHEEKLLSVLENISQRGVGSISTALGLKSEFQAVLDELYDDIKSLQEEEFEKEQDHYGQTTDGSWLKQREEQVSALIEATYLQRRTGLIDLLLAWMGDVARLQSGVRHLDLPNYENATARLAEIWPPQETHKRIQALRRLEQNLHTNVNESLALEVAFIQAFGR